MGGRTMAWWTPERMAELERRWRDGETASEIVEAMGAFSRCAVQGKLHRMGLSRGFRSGPRKQPPKRHISGPIMFRVPPPMPRQAPQMAADASAPHPSSRCDLMGLTNQRCRWPVTEGSPFLFCGHPGADAAHGVSYCPYHARMAYQRSGGRNEAVQH